MTAATLLPAGAYYRVSSKSQKIDSQRHVVEQAATARGFTLITIFVERYSAATTKRPELDRLRAEARAGRLPPVLFVFRYDRLTRSGILDTLQLVRELRDHGVVVVSINEDFPMTGPVGELVLSVMAMCNQMERLAGEERRAASREKRKAAGLAFGRPRRITPAQEVQVLQLRQEGRSLRAIAVAVKVPFATVRRALVRAVSKVGPEEAGSPQTG